MGAPRATRLAAGMVRHLEVAPAFEAAIDRDCPNDI